MALIPESYSEIVYTHYRDIVVRMSDVQKVQSMFIPDGVDPSDYEMLVSELSSNGDIVYYNYYPNWTTLPALPNFSDFVPLASCEVSTATGSTGPVPPSVTAWFQCRLTVRRKTNHSDMATGVIRLVPTVNLNNGSSGIVGWKGDWSGTHNNSSGVGSVARSELELRLHDNGSWQVWHYKGDGKAATLQGDGIWLPTGGSASNFTFAYSAVTGQFATSMQINNYLTIPTLEKYHSVRSWARKISAGEIDDLTIYMSMTIGIKNISTGAVSTATINFENVAMA